MPALKDLDTLTFDINTWVKVFLIVSFTSKCLIFCVFLTIVFRKIVIHLKLSHFRDLFPAKHSQIRLLIKTLTPTIRSRTWFPLFSRYNIHTQCRAPKLRAIHLFGTSKNTVQWSTWNTTTFLPTVDAKEESCMQYFSLQCLIMKITFIDRIFDFSQDWYTCCSLS